MILKQKLKNYWDNKKSFSLIEIIVVISLITIIVSFVIPKQKSLKTIIINNEVENLFSTFSFLQQKAIASNTRQELCLTTTANSYFYKTDKKLFTHKFSKEIKFGFLPFAKGPPSNPKKKIDRAITFKKFKNCRKVFFYPSGKITAGTIYLTDKKQKLMNALTCPISQVSFIRKYKYKKKWYSLI